MGHLRRRHDVNHAATAAEGPIRGNLVRGWKEAAGCAQKPATEGTAHLAPRGTPVATRFQKDSRQRIATARWARFRRNGSLSFSASHVRWRGSALRRLGATVMTSAEAAEPAEARA